jgi:uncharacterized protein YdhG (YjbR/CyaY superfamily)
MTIIEEYINKLESNEQPKLLRIRRLVLKYVPDAEEVINYGMPSFKYKGKAFFGFDLHKEHIGLYPYGAEPIEVFKDQLKEYSLTKGAIRVPLDKEFPESLLKDIIAFKISKIKSALK